MSRARWRSTATRSCCGCGTSTSGRRRASAAPRRATSGSPPGASEPASSRRRSPGRHRPLRRVDLGRLDHIMHVVGREGRDGIPHMIHLLLLFMFLEVAQLLAPRRRLGHGGILFHALLRRAPLRGRPHQEILLVRGFFEPVPDFIIFAERHDVRFGYRRDLGPVLAAVADRHFRGTFLGEEPGAARGHPRDQQLQLLQIRVEDG